MDEEKKVENTDIEDSSLTEEPQKDHYSIPWKGFLIVFGILTVLIVTCVIVILCNGGFYQW